MKKKDITTIAHMKPMELSKVIVDTERKLANWLVTRYSKQSKNVREGRNFKRKIAIVKTITRLQEMQHA